MKINSFSELIINHHILHAIEDLNYTTPTPIQKEAIPVILAGKDLIGQAQTGTGKTAAFSIPMINKINPNLSDIQGLVLCPTRELAIQVSNDIRDLTKYLEGIRVLPVYGGQSYDIQIRALKKRPQIIVGTPGRIIDLMNRSLLKFDHITTVVLDEADEMLKMGFQEDLETILRETPTTRQTVMFSATMPEPILAIANKYLKDYEKVQIAPEKVTVDKIEQSYFLINREQKIDLLIRLIDFYQFNSVMVFCNTKKDVDELVLTLQSHDYVTEGLHGDLKQAQRDRVMNSFRKGNVQILVATDVAARGLDIDDVDAVINFDIPLEEESYVHRVGRTGRAGKEGKAFTFVTKRQIHILRNIEKYINRIIPAGKIPSISELNEALLLSSYQLIVNKINSEKRVNYQMILNKLIAEGYTMDQILNGLFGLITNTNAKEYQEIEILSTTTKPSQSKKDQKSSRKGEKNGKSREKKVIVFLGVGSKHRVSVGNLLSALEKAKINRKQVGNIEINKKGSYIELNMSDAQKLSSLKSININGYETQAMIV